MALATDFNERLEVAKTLWGVDNYYTLDEVYCSEWCATNVRNDQFNLWTDIYQDVSNTIHEGAFSCGNCGKDLLPEMTEEDG